MESNQGRQGSFPFPSVVSAKGWLLQLHIQYQQWTEINLYGKIVVSFSVLRMVHEFYFFFFFFLPKSNYFTLARSICSLKSLPLLSFWKNSGQEEKLEKKKCCCKDKLAEIKISSKYTTHWIGFVLQNSPNYSWKWLIKISV